MALSGRIDASYAGGAVIMRIDWSATQDVSANTSTITATAKMIFSSSEDVYQRFNNTFRIDGDEYQYTFSENPDGEWGREFTLYTKTKAVTHDATGNRSVELYNEYRMQREIFGYTLTNISVSGTAVLDTIAAASTFASVTPTVEVNGSNACAVSIQRATSGMWHKVQYYLSSTYQYTTGAVQTGASYVIPMTWLNGITGGTSATMTVTLTTYRDQALTQQAGSPVSRTVTLTVPASVKPTVASGWATAAPYSDNATVTGWGIYLQNYTGAQVSFDTSKETMAYGATVASRKITCGSTVVTASPYKTGVLATSGSKTITCTITDSRGRTATQTLTVTVQAYAKPKPQNPTAFRATQDGTASSNGTYIAVRAGLSYSSASSHNSASLRARYRASGGNWSSWTTITADTLSVIGGGAILTTATYEAQIQAIDSLSNTDSAAFEIGTKAVMLHFRDGGTGGGIGKYGETNGALEMGWFLKPGSDAIRKATLAAFSPRSALPMNGVLCYENIEEMGASASMTTAAFGTDILDQYELAVVAINSSATIELTDVPAKPGMALFMKHESSVYGLLLAQAGTIWHYYYNGYTQTGAWKQITSA